jgi:hypothetical protein
MTSKREAVASNGYGEADHCARIPPVAHGHYTKDLVGQLMLVCDPGYYVTGAACARPPSARHGHYEKDFLGEAILVCNAGYGNDFGSQVPGGGVTRRHGRRLRPW